VKPSSRWLLVFGVTIGVLVIVAIVLVLTIGGAREVPLLSEDTPGGTVQRYFLALEAEDYLKAYSYLSPPPGEKLPPYEQWRGPVVRSEEKPGWKVTLGKSVVTGNEATVDVVVNVFRPGGPFDNPVRTQYVTFFLKKEGTSWRITSPWDVWWLFY
jgi:hypothetical protein